MLEIVKITFQCNLLAVRIVTQFTHFIILHTIRDRPSPKKAELSSGKVNSEILYNHGSFNVSNIIQYDIIWHHNREVNIADNIVGFLKRSDQGKELQYTTVYGMHVGQKRLLLPSHIKSTTFVAWSTKTWMKRQIICHFLTFKNVMASSLIHKMIGIFYTFGLPWLHTPFCELLEFWVGSLDTWPL